jgi:phospholipase C
MSGSTSPKFDHVVVLMFENRSFDNLLGFLYTREEKGGFEGVYGRDLRNSIPAGLDGAEGGTVAVHVATTMDTPDPDPGEEYPHTNTQLYGSVSPPENRFKDPRDMEAPFNAPQDPSAEPSMDGFVSDYVNAFRVEMGRLPTYSEYSQIMGCYTPQQVPVLSTLARGFAVFDHWFCEVPSQTYANRSFFHAASSSGFVDNAPVDNFVLRNNAPTIFERLEAAHLAWKVYIDPAQVVPATALIHARRLAPYFADHFSTIYDFYADATAGTLPAYSFIEPNLVPPHTDMHPPGAARFRQAMHLPPPTAIQGGERLLARVYESVRGAVAEGGSNWKNTLMVVTFDEHGGTYDHVPPPRVPAPDPAAPVGQMGFRFDRSGVRIPTIVISAWVEEGTVVRSEFRSTSVIRTLRERWSLGDPLTQRDAIAPDIAPLLTRTSPRLPESWPQVSGGRLGPLSEAVYLFDRPMASLGRDLLAAALVHESNSTGEQIDVDTSTITHREARARLKSLRATTFAGVTNGRQS